MLGFVQGQARSNHVGILDTFQQAKHVELDTIDFQITLSSHRSDRGERPKASSG